MSEGRASERTGGVDILDFLDLLRIVNQIQIKLITVKLELKYLKKNIKNENLNQGWSLDLKFGLGDLGVVVVVDRENGIKS